MFHTCPVKIRMIDPNSTPSCRLGNNATIASITPGRKLNTGMDCRISSSGISTISARFDLAAMYPYASANTRLSAYATSIRTSEYIAYRGRLLGSCEISASTFTGPSHDRPIEYTPKITANTPANTAMSIKNAYAQRAPNGLFAGGGIGPDCWDNATGEGTGSSGFC